MKGGSGEGCVVQVWEGVGKEQEEGLRKGFCTLDGRFSGKDATAGWQCRVCGVEDDVGRKAGSGGTTTGWWCRKGGSVGVSEGWFVFLSEGY